MTAPETHSTNMMYDEQKLQELSVPCSMFCKDSAKLPQLATLFNRFLNGFGSVYTVRFDRSGKLILSDDGPGIISQLSEDTHREINDICQILVESFSEGMCMGDPGSTYIFSVAMLNLLLSNFLRCFSFNDRSINVKLSPKRRVSVSVSSSGPLSASGSRAVVPFGVNVPDSTGLRSGTGAKGSTGLLLGPGLQLSRSVDGQGLMLSRIMCENDQGLLLGPGLQLSRRSRVLPLMEGSRIMPLAASSSRIVPLAAGARIMPLAASSSSTVPFGVNASGSGSTGPLLSRSGDGDGLMLSGNMCTDGPALLLGPGLGIQLINPGNSGLRNGSENTFFERMQRLIGASRQNLADQVVGFNLAGEVGGQNLAVNF